MDTYTLYDINEYIRRVMLLNLPDPLSITAEIAQVNEARGHYFLELVQKAPEAGDIIARSQAVIWAKRYGRLRRQLGPQLNAVLKEGLEVLFKAKVDFHERYGLKLIIEEVDPSYTLGKLELQRRQTIETLKEAKLLDKNRALDLPPVIQKVALISSENAAGFQDFTEQLFDNPFGYDITFQLFESSVQGINAEKEMIAQLKAIQKRSAEFDCVAIIRGGGARLDLGVFDKLELAKKVANMPLPVLVGVGHDIDQTVLDLLAHTSLKTPTALADFIINHNFYFENELLTLGGEINRSVQRQLYEHQHFLNQLAISLKNNIEANIQQYQHALGLLGESLKRQMGFALRIENEKLDKYTELIKLLHPDAIMKRGFSLLNKDGKIVHSINQLKEKDKVRIHLSDGEVGAIIKE